MFFRNIMVMNQKDVWFNQLLRSIVIGNQTRVEELLKRGKKLSLMRGSVVDHHNESYDGCTGLQLSFALLDCNMCEAIKFFMTKEEVKNQLEIFTQDIGISCISTSVEKVEKVIALSKDYAIRYSKNGLESNQKFLVTQVGGAQRSLPINFIQEYTLPGRLMISSNKSLGLESIFDRIDVVNDLSFDLENLGVKFAIVRNKVPGKHYINKVIITDPGVVLENALALEKILERKLKRLDQFMKQFDIQKSTHLPALKPD